MFVKKIGVGVSLPRIVSAEESSHSATRTAHRDSSLSSPRSEVAIVTHDGMASVTAAVEPPAPGGAHSRSTRTLRALFGLMAAALSLLLPHGAEARRSVFPKTVLIYGFESVGNVAESTKADIERAIKLDLDTDHKRYATLRWSEVKHRVSPELRKHLDSCMGMNQYIACLARFARGPRIDADYVIYGAVKKIGPTNLLEVRVVDSRTGAIFSSASDTFSYPVEIPSRLAGIRKRLFSEDRLLPEETAESITIHRTPPRSEIPDLVSLPAAHPAFGERLAREMSSKSYPTPAAPPRPESPPIATTTSSHEGSASRSSSRPPASPRPAPRTGPHIAPASPVAVPVSKGTSNRPSAKPPVAAEQPVAPRAAEPPRPQSASNPNPPLPIRKNTSGSASTPLDTKTSSSTSTKTVVAKGKQEKPNEQSAPPLPPHTKVAVEIVKQVPPEEPVKKDERTTAKQEPPRATVEDGSAVRKRAERVEKKHERLSKRERTSRKQRMRSRRNEEKTRRVEHEVRRKKPHLSEAHRTVNVTAKERAHENERMSAKLPPAPPSTAPPNAETREPKSDTVPVKPTSPGVEAAKEAKVARPEPAVPTHKTSATQTRNNDSLGDTDLILSMFYGIIVRLNVAGPKDVPTFDAYYLNFKATFNIVTSEVASGAFPLKQTRLVRAWIELHRENLIADYRLSVDGEKPDRIDPLR